VYSCTTKCQFAATKSPSTEVLVFDYSKHPSKPTNSEIKPEVRCVGHEKEGYGLAWSSFQDGRLASAGDDKMVCVFDIQSGPRATVGAANSNVAASVPMIGPTRKLVGHADVVEDVAWHRHHKDLLASVGDDKHLFMYVFCCKIVMHVLQIDNLCGVRRGLIYSLA
jgi:histone-binding protein RBBP4